MINWNNLDTLAAFKELKETPLVDLNKVMSGEAGAERVKTYNIPMAEGLNYNFAAKKVDDTTLKALEKLAIEAELSDKFAALYNGEVVNTGENRLVLHHMTRGQLGEAVNADGVDKRIQHNRSVSLNLLTRYIMVLLLMVLARSSQLLFRLVSVEVI